MIHLGNIYGLTAENTPSVHCVIGGSPCQDLSVAGKRAGLAGERSGLFMEQIRIVKEMREYDKRRKQPGDEIYPRYMVWENVPGAFSSNNGADFQTVLYEVCKIVQEDAPAVPIPGGGWPYAGILMGDGYSVAWRLHDAQYWGVPQRRRRIALVADFGGSTAPEILFESQSLSGDFNEGGPKREGTAADSESSSGTASSYTLKIRCGCAGGGKGALVQTEKSGTLGCNNDQTLFCQGAYAVDGYNSAMTDKEASLGVNCGMSTGRNGVLTLEEPIPINTMIATRDKALGRGTGLGVGKSGDAAYTLGANHEHAVAYEPIAFTQNQRNEVRDLNDKAGALAAEPGMKQQTYVAQTVVLNDQGGSSINVETEDLSPTLRANSHQHEPVVMDMTHANDVLRITEDGVVQTLNGRMGTGGNQVPLVSYGIGDGRANEAASMVEEQAQCLKAAHAVNSVLQASAYACDMRNGRETEEVNGTLQAKESGYSVNLNNTVRQEMVVRRLTPLECERLQGFPDGWTDIGNWVDSKGKAHKASDTPRYKALGNSVALPFWRWMLERMAQYLPEGATMGSLFAGIGGFDLCWEQIHGKGTSVWSSEIEEFPIAVLKKRFGDEKENLNQETK